MTPPLTDALAKAMDTATMAVEPSPGLLTDVVRRGRRRRRNRHITVIGLVVVIASAGLLVPAALGLSASERPPEVVGGHGPHLIGPPQALYNWATRGDLAGDAGLRSQALIEWAHPTGRDVADFTPVHNPVGSPRFLWLGHTTAGPAAVLAQDADPSDGSPTAVWGVMVADAGGRLRMTGESGGLLGDPDVISFVVDPPHPQLIVLPAVPEAKVRYSTWHRVSADGMLRRTFTSLPISGGVGITSIPARQPMDTFVEVTVARRTVARGPVQSAPIQMYDLDPSRGALPVCSPCSAGPRQPKSWPLTTDPGDYEAGVALWLRRHGAEDEYAVPGDWSLAFRTPDGDSALAFQLQLHGDPVSTVVVVRRSPYARLSVADIAFDEVVFETSPLPVQVRLPRGQGWLVVAHTGARVEWRATGSGWHPVTGLAALLPNKSGITVATTLNGTRAEVTLGG